VVVEEEEEADEEEDEEEDEVGEGGGLARRVVAVSGEGEEGGGSEEEGALEGEVGEEGFHHGDGGRREVEGLGEAGEGVGFKREKGWYLCVYVCVSVRSRVRRRDKPERNEIQGLRK